MNGDDGVIPLGFQIGQLLINLIFRQPIYGSKTIKPILTVADLPSGLVRMHSTIQNRKRKGLIVMGVYCYLTGGKLNCGKIMCGEDLEADFV